MEEILSAVKRIIAEDERLVPPPIAVAAPSLARHDDGEILELTHALNADGSVRKLAPIAGNYGDADRREPTIGTHNVTRGETPSEELISQTASEAAAAAFAGLVAVQRPGDDIPTDSSLLNGMTRELLRPMLKTWLDENLPGIVERLVQAEISRIVGKSGVG